MSMANHVQKAIEEARWAEKALAEFHECMEFDINPKGVQFFAEDGSSKVSFWPNRQLFERLEIALADARMKALKEFLITHRQNSIGNVADAISEGFVTVQDAKS